VDALDGEEVEVEVRRNVDPPSPPKGWFVRQPLTRACILEDMILLSVLDLSPFVQRGTLGATGRG
jgi:hypothetical protein